MQNQNWNWSSRGIVIGSQERRCETRVAAWPWYFLQLAIPPFQHEKSPYFNIYLSMSVLILGSSLAACTLGYNWPAQLRQPVLNHAKDGARVGHVHSQLQQITLDTFHDKPPVAIILIVGGNDYSASLPVYRGHDKSCSSAEEHLTRFRTQVEQLIETIHSKFAMNPPPLGFVNLKPVSENSLSPLNAGIVPYNQVIDDVVKRNASWMALIDIHAALVGELSGNAPLLGINDIVSPWRMVKAKCKYATVGGWYMTHDDIGKGYGFQLSCDGIHWNERSGTILLGLVQDFLINKGVLMSEVK
ncbi:hypothetical protein BKA69DRAFT_154462 [Paraphysoderma sedebokerense]|nr:hypothetical protein BKA69DRAFT_154462 [Paraphysoderma sedebokerense]